MPDRLPLGDALDEKQRELEEALLQARLEFGILTKPMDRHSKLAERVRARDEMAYGAFPLKTGVDSRGVPYASRIHLSGKPDGAGTSMGSIVGMAKILADNGVIGDDDALRNWTEETKEGWRSNWADNTALRAASDRALGTANYARGFDNDRETVGFVEIPTGTPEIDEGHRATTVHEFLGHTYDFMTNMTEQLQELGEENPTLVAERDKILKERYGDTRKDRSEASKWMESFAQFIEDYDRLGREAMMEYSPEYYKTVLPLINDNEEANRYLTISALEDAMMQRSG